MTRASLRSDAELIVASQDDPRAFRELYDRWADTLLGYLYRRVRDVETAADLLAETFAVAYERRGPFQDVGKPGGAWLYGVARRELSRYFRRSRVELRAVRRIGLDVPQLDRDSIEAIEALEAGDADQAKLTDAIGRLSVSERDAVHLRVVAELDYSEIAQRLRCSEGAARTRVHRGLARRCKGSPGGRGNAACSSQRAAHSPTRPHRLMPTSMSCGSQRARFRR